MIVKYLFHEGINDVSADDLLGFSPETEDVVCPEAFKHIGHKLSFCPSLTLVR
jgi:hypothetical protein